MKKIIASLTPSPDYQIADQAAKAPFFLVFEDDEFIETLENPFIKGLGGGGGLGLMVAEFLNEQGCELFVAGKIGNNLKNMLEKNGIKYEIK